MFKKKQKKEMDKLEIDLQFKSVLRVVDKSVQNYKTRAEDAKAKMLISLRNKDEYEYLENAERWKKAMYHLKRASKTQIFIESMRDSINDYYDQYIMMKAIQNVTDEVKKANVNDEMKKISAQLNSFANEFKSTMGVFNHTMENIEKSMTKIDEAEEKTLDKEISSFIEDDFKKLDTDLRKTVLEENKA